MESNHVDESENSNEDNNVGVGRSYECVFCKRGFTTAQALGGHMNIHRKDKAKNKPTTTTTTTTSNKHDQESSCTGPRVYQQIFASHEAKLINYRTFFPASSTSSAKSSYDENHCNNSSDGNKEGLNPYGDDWKLRFSSQFGAEFVENMGKMSNDKKQENDLDLELRLGPDP